jgi:hypothetical protein
MWLDKTKLENLQKIKEIKVRQTFIDSIINRIHK